MICNRDCFHCQYSDCVCSSGITKWERRVMKGAHGQWDFENKLKRYLKMKSAGWSQMRISLALDASDYTMRKIKNAARDGNRKAAKQKSANCIVKVGG